MQVLELLCLPRDLGDIPIERNQVSGLHDLQGLSVTSVG